MKTIFVFLFLFFLQGCNQDLDEAIKVKESNGVRHITTSKGVDCVVYKFTAHYKGGAGISCNWDKYNKQNN